MSQATRANPQPKIVQFTKHIKASLIEVDANEDAAKALQLVGVDNYNASVVMHSGSGNMSATYLEKLNQLFTHGLARFAEDHQVLIADGGTNVGGAKLIGRGRRKLKGTFPLIGLCPSKKITYPNGPSRTRNRWSLNRHHSHFIIVDGDEFGDESPLLIKLVDAKKVPKLALIVNGGEIVQEECEKHAQNGTPILTLKGSGRFADKLAESTPSSKIRAHYPRNAIVNVFDTTQQSPQSFYQLLSQMLPK